VPPLLALLLAALCLRFLVSILKRWLALRGNAVQTLTAGLALVGTVCFGGALRMYEGGLDALELGALLCWWVVVFVAAIGTHEVLSDRGGR
jgi:hypothetical protein